jgi:hypothetical protein
MEDTVKTRGMILAFALLSSIAGSAQVAQIVVKPLTDDDIKLIRQDVQSIKDDVIRDTMQFNDTESAAFWPVYKQYAAEQHAIAEKRFGIIMDYAKTIDTMTDANANDLTQKYLTVEDDTQALRKQYLPKFEAAIGAKRAAKFYQVDNRLTLIVNLQLASEIPLIP